MFFGEFLIVKKVISEDQLLDALTFQVEHMPSFLRVLRDENIVSSSELFRMIKVQLETNSDLVGILRDENKIDEKQLHNLFTKQAHKRKMLGEVLVELKITDQATVENMLYDFLRDKENLKTLKAGQQNDSVEKVSKNIEINEAALESLRELGMAFDEAPSPKSNSTVAVEANIFVEEFLNVFNPKMKNKLGKLMDMLKSSELDDSDISNYFNSLYRDFHVLKGAAQVGELTITEAYVSAWEDVIAKILSKKNDEIKVWCKAGLPELENGISQLWKMRESIDKDKNEVNIKPMPELLASICNL
jgi:hypothetical protein